VLPETRNTPAKPADSLPISSTMLCALFVFAFPSYSCSTSIWPGGAAPRMGSPPAPPCCCHAIASGPAFLFSATARAPCTRVTEFTWISLREIHIFASKDLLKELLIICKADALAMSLSLEECLPSRNFQLTRKHEHIALRWYIAASGQTLESVTPFICFQLMLELQHCQAAERGWNQP